MTKEIQSFKKEIDDILVPHDKLEAIIVKVVEETAPKRISSIRKKVWYGASAAVITFGMVLGSAAFSPAMAGILSKVPIIGSIFSESGDPGLAQVSEQGLTNVVRESQAVGDTTLTVDEVFYDGTRFTISYSLESERAHGESYLSSGPDLTINGEPINFSAGYEETPVTANFRTGILDIAVSEDLPEDDFELGLTFHGEDDKRWNFTIPITVHADVTRVAIDHQQQAGGIDLTVSDLKMGPTRALITFHTISKEDNWLSSFLEFKVVDERGNEIKSYSGGSQGELIGEKVYTTGSHFFDPISDDVKELTFIPYLDLPADGGGVEIDEDGNKTELEFELSQGEDIQFDSFTVPLSR